jgi:hypothetical protein
MIADFIRQLRLLPYNDMMVVAKELNGMLAKMSHGKREEIPRLDAVTLADALGQLSTLKLADSPDTTQEAKLLREIFTRRRAVSIKADGPAYTIQIESLGASVMHSDLKIGLQQLLDTVVTAHALRK